MCVRACCVYVFWAQLVNDFNQNILFSICMDEMTFLSRSVNGTPIAEMCVPIGMK